MTPVLLAVALLMMQSPAALAPPTRLDELVANVQQRVVKLYGAGIGFSEGYGSGVLVSADGQIVTADTTLLEGREIRVVLADGRRLPAEVVKRDERRQLALLKVDLADAPHAPPASTVDATPGETVLAVSNVFKIAEGVEPATVAFGAYAGRTKLDARRRQTTLAYDGDVLLTDIVTSTPGAAGGGLFDLQGRLIGVIGEAALSRRTNTWLNYAIPGEEVAAFLKEEATDGGEAHQETPHAAVTIGVTLFDVGGRGQPPFVERVHWESPAQAAGLAPDDLIVSIDGRMVATCDGFDAALAALTPGAMTTVVVKRGGEVLTFEVDVQEAPR